MTPTITITEEAQAFFARNPEPELRKLVDLGIKEYGEFMGGLPVLVDSFDDEESGFSRVSISVEAPAANGSLMGRLMEFGRTWRPRRSRDENRRISFSIRYV